MVHVTNARSGALQKQLSLAFVARERCGAFEFRAGFGGATEFGEQVATHARQELIVFESGSRNQPIDISRPAAGPNGQHVFWYRSCVCVRFAETLCRRSEELAAKQKERPSAGSRSVEAGL
ncbi:MAG: hypothetical protein IPN66_13780 [Candidatus Competibacteraceae bacterium]|nr:hypothetical protein [Candidatus Competibacteraceae bacterium]